MTANQHPVDYTLYDYFPVASIPNTQLRVDKNVCTSVPFTELTGIYGELIQKLARRDKTRKFVACCTGSIRHARPDDENSSRYVTNVMIYDTDSGAYLGRIWKEYNKWCVTNERISGAMKHKSVRKTEDMKKAIKLVDEFFFAPTILEAMSEARSKARSITQDARYTLDRRLRDTAGIFSSDAVLTQFVLPHLEELTQLTAIPPQDKMKLTSLAENLSAHKIAEDVDTSMRHGQYDMVVIRNGVYYVGSAAEQIQYTTDTLPAYIKLAVAKLKLSSDNTVMEGAGVRISPTTFAIFKETQ